MDTLEIYNFLDGKNLCNLFANQIVKKINETFPNAETEISVVNVRNFFAINGRTSSNVVLNIAETLHEYISKFDEELVKKIRVIDLIKYETSPEFDHLNLKYHQFKELEMKKSCYQKTINSYAKEKVYFNIKVEEITKTLYFDCSEEQLGIVKGILEKYFPEYNFLKSDFSNEIYISDRIYGLSTNEKLYHQLLKYITNHVFSLGISKEVDIVMNSVCEIKRVDNENINFCLRNSNHIVLTNWLESLILDIFPFDIESLKEKFDSNCDLEDDILCSDDTNYKFEKLDLIGEMVLV
jgi:hypothetical protein